MNKEKAAQPNCKSQIDDSKMKSKQKICTHLKVVRRIEKAHSYQALSIAAGQTWQWNPPHSCHLQLPWLFKVTRATLFNYWDQNKSIPWTMDLS